MSPMRIVSQAPCGSQWACTMDIYGVFWVSGVVCSGVGEVSVWEFSGYEPYHVTYDLFIGDASCINIIVVSLQDSANIQLSQIVFWLNFIRTRLAPQQTFGWLIHKRHCRHCHHTTNTFDFLGQELIPHSSCCSCCCCGDALQKSPKLHHFKSDWDEVWQDWSWSKYAWIFREILY